MANDSGSGVGGVRVRDFLPWAQLAALIVAAVVAVQSIRSTTDLLGHEIKALSTAIFDLKTAVTAMDSRVTEIEKQRAYEKGMRDGRAG